MKRFPLFFTIITAITALVGVFREDFGQAIEQTVAQTGEPTFFDQQMQAFVVQRNIEYTAKQAAAQGKVFICDYLVWPVEVKNHIIRHGNFPADTIPDRYHQDKPYRLKFPGKKQPPEETLLKVVPAQQKGAKVVAISNVERQDRTCKIYDFSPPLDKK